MLGYDETNETGKNNRIAIIVAALTILLCFVILTGSTLALFTSGNDGKIGINSTAGNLRVDIVDLNEKKPESLVGDVLNFETNSQNFPIYFEPGAVYYTEGFRIMNRGNIPLNFILYISEDDTFRQDFFDAFEVWITTDKPTRENPVDPDKREPLSELPKFKGSLEPDELSQVYYLVFRMKETAGNEFQNQLFTGVGITACAVQGNVNLD